MSLEYFLHELVKPLPVKLPVTCFILLIGCKVAISSSVYARRYQFVILRS